MKKIFELEITGDLEKQIKAGGVLQVNHDSTDAEWREITDPKIKLVIKLIENKNVKKNRNN